jgi:sialate O-acetylesterase
MWFRTTFPLTQAEARGDLVLGLARIDDSDTTWVNGREVGSTRGYDQVRRYVVPAGLLHAGDNSLAVRVEDTGVGGGIYSDEALLFVQPAGGAPRSLKGQWRVRPDKVRVQPTGEMNQVETALYNKMIHPLLETPVRGVLWYQGESNAGSAAQAIRYAGQFRSLIWTWRAAWKQPEMPFYWVQLPNFESGWGTDEAIPWALLRESQAGALALPHTGQAVTLDVGDAHDIHPRDKKTVGERLALVALHETYGKKNVHFRGPVLAATRIEPTRVVARFTTTSGLSTRKPGARVVGLELGGAGGKFEAAQGVVAGDDVFIPYRGKAPTMLRYAWDDNPEAANLQDRDGMPAEPFRARLER